MSIELKDKLYTSTQVAEILGVSLRTLYRYMEDGRIGSMRTASGRHRFTKDQILDFLNAGNLTTTTGLQGEPLAPSTPNPQESVVSPMVGDSLTNDDNLVRQDTPKSVDQSSVNTEVGGFTKSNVSGQGSTSTDIPPVVDLSDYGVGEQERSVSEVFEKSEPVVEDDIDDPVVAEIPVGVNAFEDTKPSPVENKVDDSTVASQFGSSAQSGSGVGEAQQTTTEPLTTNAQDHTADESLSPVSDLNIRYYKSDISDLIRLAKKIHEVADVRDLEYAFSGHAGLSLHFLIKETFTLLHFYANPEDMQIWREELSLTPVAKKESANIGIIVNTDIVFVPTKEISGFRVVEDKVLLRDLTDQQELELARQFRTHLANATS